MDLCRAFGSDKVVGRAQSNLGKGDWLVSMHRNQVQGVWIGNLVESHRVAKGRRAVVIHIGSEVLRCKRLSKGALGQTGERIRIWGQCRPDYCHCTSPVN